MQRICPFVLGLLFFATACTSEPETTHGIEGDIAEGSTAARPIEARLGQYVSVRLESDLSLLSEAQRSMLPLLIEASKAMDRVFWKQAYGDRDALLASLDDPDLERYAEINYGPWDRLAGNEPFIEGVGAKPPGANFYPADITKEELREAVDEAKNAGDEDRAAALVGLYSIVRRDDAGRLQTQSYSEAYADDFSIAAENLREAAALAADAGLRHYLELRADALLSNDYRPSDLAWMDMKENRLDIVIGPIESYEDGLFGYRTAAEAYVLVKDLEWSGRIGRYASLLPQLQGALPVDDAYKQEQPGTDSDLGAYEVLYYAGDCNAGSKTIAINLPNDERVQLEKGTRRLQLKNAMRAKFDEILAPISRVLISPEQRRHVTFEAFFSNTMFHEVAHGLGIKQTISGRGTVRTALAELAGSIEEGKADVLGLFMVRWLVEAGEIENELDDNYVTFLASIFRSIRFGSASAHGRANLLRFHYFRERKAFTRSDTDGTYAVDFERMQEAVRELSNDLLRLQGDGDYEAASRFIDENGQLGETLQADLDRLSVEGIPVDIVFEQGMSILMPSGEDASH